MLSIGTSILAAIPLANESFQYQRELLVVSLLAILGGVLFILASNSIAILKEKISLSTTPSMGQEEIESVIESIVQNNKSKHLGTMVIVGILFSILSITGNIYICLIY